MTRNSIQCVLPRKEIGMERTEVMRARLLIFRNLLEFLGCQGIGYGRVASPFLVYSVLDPESCFLETFVQRCFDSRVEFDE